MLNELNMKNKQYETYLDEVDKVDYLKRAMLYNRKETLNKISKENPFIRDEELDILDLGCKIVSYNNSFDTLYDPIGFIKLLLDKDVNNRKSIQRLIKKLLAKECLYSVYVADKKDAHTHLKSLIDTEGVVYMLLKAQDYEYPHSELLLRAFARTVNAYRSFMGLTLSEYISSVVTSQAIKPITELQVAIFAPQTDKIKFRFVSEYILDKNNKVLLGDEDDLAERLVGSRKAVKYMFYFDISDDLIINILTKLYPDILVDEIRDLLSKLVDQAKIKFKAIKDYNRVYITDNMLWDLVRYCEGGIPNMKPVVEELMKVYKMDEDEQRIFIDSFYYLHEFDYSCDISFFDKYEEIFKEFGLE